MSQQKSIAVSGVQPTGVPTLGNLLGAFQPFTKFQNDYEVYFFVVDLHALTVRPDPAQLRENTLNVAAWYLAAGLDPAKCTLFVQSDVPEHSELAWILNTFTQMGELERMTQFKDKASRQKDNINAGLFTYPALMAADILLYEPEVVPVGDDQRQHLELTRDIAIRINNLYDNVLTVPKGVYPPHAARVMDLQDPTSKMSKSSVTGGTVLLTDDLKQVEKKIKRAVTDTIGKVALDIENQPGIANLLSIYAAASNQTLEAVTAEFAGQEQYGPLKTKVAEAVVACMEPVQQRYKELTADPAELRRILDQGGERARAKAGETLLKVQQAVGLRA